MTNDSGRSPLNASDARTSPRLRSSASRCPTGSHAAGSPASADAASMRIERSGSSSRRPPTRARAAGSRRCKPCATASRTSGSRSAASASSEASSCAARCPAAVPGPRRAPCPADAHPTQSPSARRRHLPVPAAPRQTSRRNAGAGATPASATCRGRPTPMRRACSRGTRTRVGRAEPFGEVRPGTRKLWSCRRSTPMYVSVGMWQATHEAPAVPALCPWCVGTSKVVGEMALRADRVALGLLLQAVRVVTVRAGHAGCMHLALEERAVVVDLVLHLPVRPVQPFGEQRRPVRHEERLARHVRVESFRSTGMTRSADLDFRALIAERRASTSRCRWPSASSTGRCAARGATRSAPCPPRCERPRRRRPRACSPTPHARTPGHGTTRTTRPSRTMSSCRCWSRDRIPCAGSWSGTPRTARSSSG